MDKNPITRPFKPDEWKIYKYLRMRSLSESPDAFGSTLAREEDRSDREWADRLEAGVLSATDLPLMAELDGKAIGLCWGRIEESKPEIANLYQMWVDPEQRGNGAGKMLLDTVIDWAKRMGCSSLVLGVTLRENPAMRFYQRAGFEPVGQSQALRPGSEILMQEMCLKLKLQIETERLTLTQLSLDQLRSYLDAPEKLEWELGFKISHNIVTDRLRRALKMKVSKMEQANLHDHVWLTYWLIVIKDVPFGAGLAGFKGVPDERGITEIGYGIDECYRSKGYMTEAVKGLIAWAFWDECCRTIFALDTKKENKASNRVLEKAGMLIFNETADACDWRIDKAV